MRTSLLGVAVAVALAVSWLPAAPAVAAGPCPPATDCPPPTVTTGRATDVTDTTATLGGTVNGNGAAVGYTYAYGPTTNYGSTTPLSTLPPSSAPQDVPVTITGLQPDTTYHFRLAAGSPAPAVGEDVTFKTRSTERRRPTLTLKVTPKRDRTLPYTFTSTGRLRFPTGVAAQDDCSGTVAIQFKTGAKTISTRRTRVRSDCTYSRSVTFNSRKRLTSNGTLKLTARYGGSRFLKSARKTTSVRYGS
jgi:hypothetical protein